MQEKLSFLNLSYQEIVESLEKNGHQAFRAKQIMHWIYQKGCSNFEDMKNLPKNLLVFLEENFTIHTLKLDKLVPSSNSHGTVKFLYQTYDNHFIETILMPNSKGKYTICLSSQIGCNMNCDFCATGKMGLFRSLNIDEVIGQYMLAEHKYPISNIVFMGMGEPFLNNDFFTILQRLIDAQYCNFPARCITVSTTGIVEGIKEMIHYKQVKLALSYHSSIEETRALLFPTLSMRHSYDELVDAILYYRKNTQKRITLEYTLIKNINDTQEEADKLLKLNEQLYFFLNIIPYNEHAWSPYESPSDKDIKRFVQYLNNKIPVHVRYSKGSDINAACGQLAYEKNKE